MSSQNVRNRWAHLWREGKHWGECQKDHTTGSESILGRMKENCMLMERMFIFFPFAPSDPLKSLHLLLVPLNKLLLSKFHLRNLIFYCAHTHTHTHTHSHTLKVEWAFCIVWPLWNVDFLAEIPHTSHYSDNSGLFQTLAVTLKNWFTVSRSPLVLTASEA